MPDAILDLALKTAATPAVGLDLNRHLTEVCTTLVETLRVTAAVVVVLDPRGAHGSDGDAVMIGAAQLGAPVGPVANALRSGRPLLTPDLLRVGPPALAAAAAECGLVSSGVVPLSALDRPVGAVQLLGAPGAPSTTATSTGSRRWPRCWPPSWRTSPRSSGPCHPLPAVPHRLRVPRCRASTRPEDRATPHGRPPRARGRHPFTDRS